MTTTTPTEGLPRYVAVTFDCADPAALARFYHQALGLPVIHSSDHFVLLGVHGGPDLGFTRVEDYQPPTWPAPARGKQAHLELGVEDLDGARDRLVALGAVEAVDQPAPDRWRVLLDPAGHPFCLSTLV
ncbi:VOC family protein [Actinoalloteichus sp. AHMU CJ021]|uniref:Glyoxalase-like domain-containing protein n=1 Tax=Actinoalloteichus caeruleus DSM 43889 TaxID=1120930 RepID=A0ABT1JE77_ACTCY|nr:MULTISPECIES: VOC family protein [Actinoalloteichus]AUS80982.1 VOC family protein [Actinoalloteichus sp. AHMU CJ021]MCP2330436.1 Glyoxalase-like domain-containing protein [Actinoalloteichus caeruleus DSM 43889]